METGVCEKYCLCGLEFRNIGSRFVARHLSARIWSHAVCVGSEDGSSPSTRGWHRGGNRGRVSRLGPSGERPIRRQASTPRREWSPAALEVHLTSHSYVNGWVPTEADVLLYHRLQTPPAAPATRRWHKHVAALQHEWHTWPAEVRRRHVRACT